MANYRDPDKERFWRQQVRSWQRSGLTICEFCRRNHLAEHNFHAWRRELAWRDRETNGQEGHPATFIPLVVKAEPPRAEAAIEIVLANGRNIRVRPGFEAETLTQVVAVLEGSKSC
jgi:transposase